MWYVKVLVWAEVVTFLHSGWYRAVFCICAEHGLIIQRCFLLLLNRNCIEPRPFLVFVQPHCWEGWGCVGGWRRQMGLITPRDHRNIPDHVTSCSVYKVEGRRRKEGMFGVMVVLPSHHYMWYGSALLRMAKHLPTHVNSFLALLCLCAQLLFSLLNTL